MTDENIKLLDELAKRLGIAIDWTSENVMPYLLDLYERFIAYRLVINLSPLIVFVVATVAAVYITAKIDKGKNNEKESFLVKKERSYFGDVVFYKATVFAEILEIMVWAIAVAAFVFSIFSVGNVFELIFVPEIYVVEYLNVAIG